MGGAAGAGIGALLGGKKGALIGAGVGALAGGSVGLYLDKQKNDTGSDGVKAEGVNDLAKMGDILAKYSDDQVRIEGHTDSSGDAGKNQGLSERRAQAVKTVLVSRGVQEQQITVVGLGETKPVADNATPDGRAKNRRVELHITVPNPS